jgi:hypothetical protein
VHGFGCQLIFWAERWAKFGISPIWFRVSSDKWKLPEGLHGPVADTLPDPTWLRAEDGRDWPGLWFPLRLMEGRERDVVIADVMSQLERVANVLSAHAKPAPVVAAPAVLPTDPG